MCREIVNMHSKPKTTPNESPDRETLGVSEWVQRPAMCLQELSHAAGADGATPCDENDLPASVQTADKPSSWIQLYGRCRILMAFSLPHRQLDYTIEMARRSVHALTERITNKAVGVLTFWPLVRAL